MNFDDDTFEKQVRQAEIRQRDFDDLQREVAGVEVGRITRFLPEGARGQDAVEKRKAERAEMLTRLQQMMRDPEYAALYNDTTNRLREAQNALDGMREQAQRLLDEQNEAIARIDARAARDADGRAVFKDRNGGVRYADGELVSEEAAAAIVWRGDEPGFEEREAHAQHYARIEGVLFDIDAGQAEIGEMQERLEDEKNPVSTPEMKDFQDRAREIEHGNQSRLNEVVLSPVQEPEVQIVSTYPQSTPAVPSF